MTYKEIEQQVSQLKEGLVTVMDRINDLSRKSENYPKPTESFKYIQQTMIHPNYDIVVCGEVKKGKSTLLNAIIGQDILPVDNEIATSQVFRISNSAVESYALVFDDGSQQSISRDELSKYGSQTDANLYGSNSFNGKTIAHIQINIPVEFLPENVSLVDTPGLGAIYKSHEWITQNYVKKAAGVIFVFDSTSPLVKAEEDFTKKVLKITPYMMFVMTKIDTVATSEWTSLLHRTEDKLSELFRSLELDSPTIFPVSSKALRKASETDGDFRENYINTSMFPTIKDELNSVITKAVALSHSSVALYEAKNQILRIKTMVADLLRVSAQQGQELEQSLRNEKLALQQKLQQAWGINSSNMKMLSDDVVRICNNVTNKVTQMFRLTSPIREHYISQIDAIKDMDGIENMCNNMPQSVANEISQQWNTIMEDAKNETIIILKQKMSEISTLTYSHNTRAIHELEITLGQSLNSVRSIIGTALLASTTVAIVQGAVAAAGGAAAGGAAAVGTLFPPLGIGVLISGALVALIAARRDRVAQNKAHLKNELVRLLDELNHRLCDVLPGKERSVVNDFIYNLKKVSENVINDIISSQKQEMQEQLEILETQAKKTVEDKRSECEVLSADLTICNNIVADINQLNGILNSIKKQINE